MGEVEGCSYSILQGIIDILDFQKVADSALVRRGMVLLGIVDGLDMASSSVASGVFIAFVLWLWVTVGVGLVDHCLIVCLPFNNSIIAVVRQVGSAHSTARVVLDDANVPVIAKPKAIELQPNFRAMRRIR